MENIKEKIWEYVWLGFYNETEIIEEMMEVKWGEFFENQVGSAQLEAFKDEVATLAKKYQSLKESVENNWKPETDLERLEQAFEELRSDTNNIIALHIAGKYYDEAIENTGAIFFEEYEDDLTEVDLTTGYCFYTVENAIELLPDFNTTTSKRGDLRIYIGNIEGDEEEGMKAGNLVFSTLNKFGFQLDWNKTLKSPITLKDFLWESRSMEWD